MKVLILLALVLSAGFVLIILAIVAQQPELLTTEQELPQASLPVQIPEPEPLLEPEPSLVHEPSSPANPPPLNTTYQACRAFEKQLLEELATAEGELQRKQREYEDAQETYDDALDADSRDPAHIQELRNERDRAQDEYEDAQDTYDFAARRLAKARAECGLQS